MLVLKQIYDAEYFDSFVLSHPYCHYLKTAMWGKFKQESEGNEFRLLAFYECNELVATAMVLIHRWQGYRYMYVPKGPCVDYLNQPLLLEVLSLLKEYAINEKVVFLRIDPNVERVHHEIDGTVIDDGFSNEAVTEIMKSSGYLHKGYGYAYNGSWTNRFTLQTELKDEINQIFSRFSKRRKRTLKKASKFQLTARRGSTDDLHILMQLQGQLTKQKGFEPNDYEYFRNIMDCFGSYASLYVTEIDIDFALSLSLEEDEKNELLYLKEVYGSKVAIAAGLFIELGKTCWCWYYYFHKAFNRFSPLDFMHAYAMEDCKRHGLEYYDFCGFSGVVSKEDPNYHLYEYKHEFDTKFIEQIGEFDYVLSPRKMKLYRFHKRVYNKLYREWAKLTFKA